VTHQRRRRLARAGEHDLGREREHDERNRAHRQIRRVRAIDLAAGRARKVDAAADHRPQPEVVERAIGFERARRVRVERDDRLAHRAGDEGGIDEHPHREEPGQGEAPAHEPTPERARRAREPMQQREPERRQPHHVEERQACPQDLVRRVAHRDLDELVAGQQEQHERDRPQHVTPPRGTQAPHQGRELEGGRDDREHRRVRGHRARIYSGRGAVASPRRDLCRT